VTVSPPLTPAHPPEPPESPEGQRSAFTLSRRTATIVAAAVALVLLVSVAALLPVPYAALSPGPTFNTLGSVNGTPLITIEGRRTYDASGHLNLTTVSESGGPSGRLDLGTALLGWLDDDVAVVPRELVYPEDQTPDEIRQRNAEDMELSQEHATAAALRELGIPAETSVVVRSVQEGAPAQGKLRAADTILRVDGQDVTSAEQVGELVRRHEPGEQVTFTVRRDGTERTVTVGTVPSPEHATRAIVGIVPDETVDPPFTIDIRLDDVGGPSAGLMFALGIVELLTPRELTGGAFVAGTGTIDNEGNVGPIGGIQQKLIAAREAGATVFLAPAANCADAARATPEGLRVVRVATLDDAVDALDALRSGDAEDVPSCTG